jgi:hypothetical protein
MIHQGIVEEGLQTEPALQIKFERRTLKSVVENLLFVRLY